MFCAARQKPVGVKKLNRKQQWYLLCGFEVSSRILDFIVIGQYTTDLSESNQSVLGFLSFTVIYQRNY